MPAEVKVLRTERAPAPPMLSAERQRLAQANDQYDEVAGRVEHAKAARDTAHKAGVAAFSAVDAARTRLREAEEAAPRRRLAELLGETADGISVAAAQRELAEVQAQLASADSDEALIKEALRALEEALGWKADARARAIAEVVAPAGAALVTRWHSLQDEIERVGQAIAAFPHGAVPNNWHARSIYFRPDKALAEQWSTALTVLEHDAGAQLPEISNSPPEAA